MIKVMLLLISSILYSNEYYFNLDNYLIDTISKSNKYCKRLKKRVTDTICFKKSIKYVKFQKEDGLKGINKGHISFIVKKEKLSMLFRVTSLDGKNHYTFMPDFSKIQDQQGFDVYKIDINRF